MHLPIGNSTHGFISGDLKASRTLKSVSSLFLTSVSVQAVFTSGKCKHMTTLQGGGDREDIVTTPRGYHDLCREGH